MDKHVGTELRAAFGELQTLAARLVDTSRAWWDNRREDMNRNEQYYGQGRQPQRDDEQMRDTQRATGRNWRSSGSDGREDGREERFQRRGEQGQRAPFGPQPGREQAGSRGYDEDLYYGSGSRYAGMRGMDDDEDGMFGARAVGGYSQGRQGPSRNPDQNLGQGSYGQPDLGQGGYGQYGSGRTRAGEHGYDANRQSRQGGAEQEYGRAGASRTGHGGYGEYGGRDYGMGQAYGDSQSGQETQGRFRGHGPKGYRRSDERITEDLNERLTEDAMLDATHITVEVRDGVATLQGTVESRWMKHRAEDIADACSGVSDVRNEIRVGAAQAAGTERSASASRGGTKDRNAQPESGAASSQVGTPH